MWTELYPLLRLISLPLCSYLGHSGYFTGKSVGSREVCEISLKFTLWKPAHSFSMDEMSLQSDSVKLCWGAKATQRLWDDSGMDGPMICGCYWIWLAISLGRKKGVRRVISAFFPSLAQCETKYICFLGECVHIKKPFPLPKARSGWGLIRYLIVWSVTACLSCL